MGDSHDNKADDMQVENLLVVPFRLVRVWVSKQGKHGAVQA